MSKEFMYNVGDKVCYVDNYKEYRTGIIKEVERTYDETRNLYLVNDYPYLRYEEEILGLVK